LTDIAARPGPDAKIAEDWQVQSLRLTAFPAPEKLPEAASWWRDLVGTDPELRESRPKSGELVEEGPFGKGRLILRIQPDRTHWVYTVAGSPEEPASPLQTIGPYIDVQKAFIPLVEKWMSRPTIVARLGFGAVMVLPATSRQDGYKKLGSYLPALKLDPDGSSDFSYSINRPRPSRTGLPDLQINRLMKFSVAAWKMLRLSVSHGKVLVAPDSLAEPDAIACVLECDINTSAEHPGEIPGPNLIEVFRELVDLGGEIATKGDTP